MTLQTPEKKPSAEPSKSKTLTIQSLFLYLVFPLSQVILLFICAQEINALYNIPMPAFYTIIAALLSFLITILYVLYTNHTKKQTKKSYQELLDIQQYQKKHYEKVQQQRQTLENLKNSFEGQLTDISALLESSDNEKALELLKTLITDIAATKEYPFCPNPVINAVLWDKEQQCLKQNIPFHAEIQLGDCASVNNVHLCSIFSNLLDNAINACNLVSDDKYIYLTARQSGDFIHIKVKNSSLPPAAPKQGHGYGHRILKDIAEQYSGDFRTQYENYTYETYISIQMP